MDKITILIADDHTLVRETWSYLFNRDARFSVIAESGNGQEAVMLAQKLSPRLLLWILICPVWTALKRPN